LKRLGKSLDGEWDPVEVYHRGRASEFAKKDGCTGIRMVLRFVSKEEVEVYRVGDELVIKLGVFKRNVPLPRSALSSCDTIKATLKDGRLEVFLGGEGDGRRTEGEA
jgi:arsenite-transporting ATPase